MKKYTLIIGMLAASIGMVSAASNNAIDPELSGKPSRAEIISPVEEAAPELENWMIEYVPYSDRNDVESEIGLEGWMVDPAAYNQAPEREAGQEVESWMLEISENSEPVEPETELEPWMLDLPVFIEEPVMKLESWMIKIHG